MKPVSHSGSAGFSIAEAIGYLVITSILMGALTYGMSTLFTQQTHPQVVYNGETYTKAPSFDDFGQATTLHAAFSDAMDLADNVIVLGGSRSHPSLDPTGPSSTLNTKFADSTLAAAVNSDGLQAYSSWDQRQLNSSQFSGYLDTNPDPADFTVLTVQGLSRDHLHHPAAALCGP